MNKECSLSLSHTLGPSVLSWKTLWISILSSFCKRYRQQHQHHHHRLRLHPFFLTLCRALSRIILNWCTLMPTKKEKKTQSVSCIVLFREINLCARCIQAYTHFRRWERVDKIFHFNFSFWLFPPPTWNKFPYILVDVFSLYLRIARLIYHMFILHSFCTCCRFRWIFLILLTIILFAIFFFSLL